MFIFRGFRASFNFSEGRQRDANGYGYVSDNMSTSGAYRSNREEFFGNGSLSGERKTITPSMVQLPRMFDTELRPAKSTGNLANNLPEHLTKSTPDVSMNPRGAQDLPEPPKRVPKTKDQIKEEKRKAERQRQIEKQRAAEQKKREKEAALEIKRIEKENKKKKKKAPVAPGNIPIPPPLPQANPTQNRNRESTLQRSSGPPPYDDVPDKLYVLPNERDHGNTSFSKPIEESSSWDLVAKHREQMPSKAGPERRQRKKVMDLNYNGNRPKDDIEV